MVDVARIKQNRLPSPPKPEERTEFRVTKSGKADWRSKKKTNRTILVANRYTERHRKLLEELADSHGKMMIEIIEEALEMYAKRYPPRPKTA